MNIFIALALPQGASKAIGSAMAAYANALQTPVPKERWHCTMLFLGEIEIPESIHSSLFQPLRQKFHPAISILSLGEHAETHQLWAYIKQGPALNQLRTAIMERVQACDIAIPETEQQREFIAHINLGSLGEKENGLHIPDTPVKTLFSPTELVVLRSNPEIQDAPYEQLGIIPLTP